MYTKIIIDYFQSLDEQLCLEIQQPPIMSNRQDKFSYRRANPTERERRPNKFYTRQRPGLEDLV